jgi:hypothetical protein
MLLYAIAMTAIRASVKIFLCVYFGNILTKCLVKRPFYEVNRVCLLIEISQLPGEKSIHLTIEVITCYGFLTWLILK